MNEKKEVPQKRITVYVPEEEYKLLKSKLALIGLSISEWFRRLMTKELNKD